MVDLPSLEKFSDQQLINKFVADPVDVINTIQSHHKLRRRLSSLLQQHQSHPLVQQAWFYANNHFAHQHNAIFPENTVKTALKNNPQLPRLSINQDTLTIRYGLLKKLPQRQPQLDQQQIPIYTPPSTEEIQDVTAQTRIEDVTERDLQALEEKLNHIKQDYYHFYADQLNLKEPYSPSAYQRLLDNQQNPPEEKYLPEYNQKFYEKASAEQSTQQLLNLIQALRFGFLPYLTNPALKSATLEALGPIGRAIKIFETTKGKLTPSQINLFFNPQAIFYYIKTLPERKAFTLMFTPVKTGFKILAHGGGPFTQVITTTEAKWNYDSHSFDSQVVKKTVFKPFYTYSKTAYTLADKIDAQFGFDTTTSISLLRQKRSYFQQLSQALQQLKSATNKKEKKEALKKIVKLQNKHHSVTRNKLKSYAKKLRQDPISSLPLILGSLIYDFSLGLLINPLRAVAIKVINAIPQLTVLQAKVSAFLNTDPIVSTLRMGGTNISHAVKGGLSSQALSSSYLGYKFGSLLFPNLTTSIFGVNFNLGGTIFATTSWGLGSYYKTALLNATQGPIFTLSQGPLSYPGLGSTPELIQWTNQYYYGSEAQFRNVFGHQVPYYQPTPLSHTGEGYQYLKSGQPGPLSRFSAYLYNHPYVRIPINGLAIGNLLSPFLQSQFGISPWLTNLATIGLDYLWQIKGVLAHDLGLFISRSPLGIWYNINISYPVQNLFNKLVYQPGSLYAPSIWPQGASLPVSVTIPQRILKPWANALQKYFGSAFNPGFFAGFSWIQPLISLGWNSTLAWIAGPAAGSSAFLLYSRLISLIRGQGLAAMPKINAAAWIGNIIGAFTLPLASALGVPYWIWMTGWTLTLPLAVAIFPSLTTFFSGLLSSVGGFAINALQFVIGDAALAIGSWMASLTAATASIAVLTVVTGFIVISAMWVNIQQEFLATPQSSHFSIQTNTTEISPGIYKNCSSFDLKENVLSVINYLTHKTDIEGTDFYVEINWDNPSPQLQAFRQDPSKPNLELIKNPDIPLSPTEYDIENLYSDPLIISGRPINSLNSNSTLITRLSTPTDQALTFFALLEQYPQIENYLTPYLEILSTLAQEELNKTEDYTSLNIQSQIDFLQTQLNLSLNVLKQVGRAANQTSPATLSTHLTQAHQIFSDALDSNPAINPNTINCNPTDSPCLTYQKENKKRFESWPNTINPHLAKINGYLNNLNNPNLTDQQLSTLIYQITAYKTSLQELTQTLEDQIDQIKNIHSTIDDINLSQADAQFIVNNNLINIDYSDLTSSQKSQLQSILADQFNSPFKPSDIFYFIPKGTNYQVCVELKYQGGSSYIQYTTPSGTPQTICNTISYTPAFFSANTAFAKHCDTITP